MTGILSALSISLSLSFLFTGCIREGRGDCIPQANLYVTVQSASEEGDFAPVEEATVYLFDQDQRYLTRIPVSRDQIYNHLPVRVPVDPTSKPWAVVWGNVGGAETMEPLRPGQTMEELAIHLRQDGEGYKLPADDLFFGIKQIEGIGDPTVVITPKTARVSLTVKGLPVTANESDFYFTVQTHYGGYDFTGGPLSENAGIRLPGVFNNWHDLVTPKAYNIIHYPEGKTTDSRQFAVVTLWARGPAGNDAEIARADKDIDGAPLLPQAGKTLNILIRFTPDGNIEVSVIMTEWNEVFQWNDW